MNEADVIPIRKRDKVKDIENDLRPISLTSVLSKTMERFVAEWIMLQISHLVDRNQFGSLPGLSTTHALLSFTICIKLPIKLTNVCGYSY